MDSYTLDGKTMKILLLIMSLLLAGCATRIPQELQAPNLSRATVAAARQHLVPSGIHVRWGGVIASVTNRPHSTWIQLISRPLRHNGRPRRGIRSDGRFLAKVPGFLDPDVYRIGRKMTVIGIFTGLQVETIGRFPYKMPVVNVLSSYLWRPRPVMNYYYSDPWPVWGWGFGPYPGWGWGWHDDDDGGFYAFGYPP